MCVQHGNFSMQARAAKEDGDRTKRDRLDAVFGKLYCHKPAASISPLRPRRVPYNIYDGT